MTKKEWMARLRSYIQGLPPEEQKRIFDYYEELYADKRDSGMSEWDIVAEFGNPQEVAGRMLTDMASLHSKDAETVPPPPRPIPAPAPRAPSAPPPPAPGYGNGNGNQNAYSAPAAPQTPPNYGYQAPPPGYGYQPLPSAYSSAPIRTEAVKEDRRELSGGRLAVFLLILIPVGLIVCAVFISLWAAMLAVTVSGFAVAIAGPFSAIYTIATQFDPATWLVYAGIALGCLGVGIIVACLGAKLMKAFGKACGGYWKSTKNFIFRRVKQK